MVRAMENVKCIETHCECISYALVTLIMPRTALSRTVLLVAVH